MKQRKDSSELAAHFAESSQEKRYRQQLRCHVKFSVTLFRSRYIYDQYAT